MLRPFLAALLFLFTALAITAVVLDVPYWILPPEQKFAKSWRDDLRLLEQKGHFPKEWNELAAIEFISNDTRVHDWYEKTKAPFTTHKNGRFNLRILAIHLLEGNRYGVVFQYNWTDANSGNTLGELGRTLKLGLVY